MEFHKKYRPIIADPFLLDQTYQNMTPSPEIKQYIRCFWGSAVNFNPHTSHCYQNRLLNPDTCNDLIFIKNVDTGRYKMLFTGLADTSTIDIWAEEDKNISLFGIRFHFWSMHCMIKMPMRNTLNNVIDPQNMFPSISELCERIFEAESFKVRVIIAETYFAGFLYEQKGTDTFLNAIDFMIKNHGLGTLTELSEHVCYSKRHVQRMMQEAVGIAPKYLMNLIRYQSIWQEMVFSKNIDYMDLVHKYNYTDQSHFIADFKKYHSTTPKEALKRIVF